VTTVIDDILRRRNRLWLCIEDARIRDLARPLIAQGYRCGELVLRRLQYNGEIVSVDVAKSRHRLVLAARRAWRHVFPYEEIGVRL
jgi:hypothetical protein